MNSKELYVICQIDDHSLKIMANRYWNNEIQVLFKENVYNQQFAENGVLIDAIKTGQLLKTLIDKINQLLRVKILRVCLNLPSNNLKIYQSQALLDFQNMSHKIVHIDVNKVIEMSQKIQIKSDEVICLTKPYNFKVDNQPFLTNPPYDAIGQTIFVESLIYTIPKQVYESQLAVISNADVDLLCVTIDQFALAFNVNSIGKQKKNMVMIDWGLEQTKISIFTNSTLYAINSIKIGYNQFLKKLMEKMHCEKVKAEKYLTRIINLNSSYLNDVVLEKYYSEQQRKWICLTKRDLQAVIRDSLNEVIEKIEYFLKDILSKDSEIMLVLNGKTTTLPGFSNYLQKFPKFKNINFFNSEVLGVNNSKWATLLGATYYQHSLNLFRKQQVFLTSTTNELLLNPNGIKNQQQQEQTIVTPHINLNYHYNKQ